MEAISHAVSSGTEQSRASFDDLRVDLLRSFAILVAVIPSGIIGMQLVDDNLRRPSSALAIVSLLACSFLAWRLAARWPLVGVALLLGGTIGSLALGLYTYPGSRFVYAFALVAVVAALLGGLTGGFATAAVISAVVLMMQRSGWGALSADDVPAVICLVWLGAIVAWLGTRATQAAVDWAWHSYEETLVKIRETRERQAELGRVSKSLAEAFVKLEHLNRELDRARQSADEARRIKTEFATTISHELRTPLNLIIGFAEMMVAAPHSYLGETLPASYRGDVEAIYRNACHLSDLLDDVLDLSQVDAHRMALQKEDVSLVRVVQEAAATVAALFRDVGLSLTIDLPSGLPSVFVDPTRIRQILINLLTNAVRFTDFGGVTVRASHDDREIVVTVTDTGSGIAPDDVSSLFREFGQGQTPRRRMGSGLGLAVSKRFAELHGGTMWVESVVGVGSTFSFSLPFVKNVVPGVADRDWRAYVGDQADSDERLAVVVGNDPTAAGVFRRYLDGVRVVGPVSLRRAKSLVAHGGIHALIVADSAAASRREPPSLGAFANLPVITCGLNTPWTRRHELGVAAYLTKPVARQQLRAALGSFGSKAAQILLVEDDPELASLLTRMVISLSPQCRVRHAGDGEEALTLMRTERPDLILLDLLLPRVDGYTVLREMHASVDLRNVPVVVITGQEQDNHQVVASEISLTRAGGLTAGEVMHFVKGVLSMPEQLAPAPPGDSPASPASGGSRPRRVRGQGSARATPSTQSPG